MSRPRFMTGFDSRNNLGHARSGAAGSSMGKFGAAAQKAIDVNALRERLRPHQALALWPQIAGEKLAAVCAAEAVRGGTLFVRVKSSAWANELTFYKADLLGKLNGRLGSKLIDDIHFATGRVASSSASPSGQAPQTRELRDLSRIAPPEPLAAAVDMQARFDHLVERTQSVLAWKRKNGWVPCARCEALFEPSPRLEAPAKPKPKGRGRVEDAALPNSRPAAPKGHVCPVCIALTNR